jgi:hypothetical protein
MAAVAEVPSLTNLDSVEWRRGVAGVVAAVGALLQDRAIDLTLSYGATESGSHNFDYCDMDLHGIDVDVGPALDLRLRAVTNSGTNVTRAYVGSSHPHRQIHHWAGQESGGAVSVISDDPARRVPVPDLAEGLQRLLRPVHGSASPVEPAAWEIMRGGSRDSITLNSYAFIPMLGGLIRDIGGVMASDLPADRLVTAGMSIGANNWAGRVYGIPRADQFVRLLVQDPEGSRRTTFEMKFRHLGGLRRGERIVISDCSLIEEDRTDGVTVVTKERVGQSGLSLYVTKTRRIGENPPELVSIEEAADDAIVAMAGKVVRLALEPSGQFA